MNKKKYTKDHEWVAVENNIAKVGISNHAQESLGDIVFIELPSIGKSVKAKDEICVIESVKAASDIYAPMDGEITEVNNDLNNDASIVCPRSPSLARKISRMRSPSLPTSMFIIPNKRLISPSSASNSC